MGLEVGTIGLALVVVGVIAASSSVTLWLAVRIEGFRFSNRTLSALSFLFGNIGWSVGVVAHDWFVTQSKMRFFERVGLPKAVAKSPQFSVSIVTIAFLMLVGLVFLANYALLKQRLDEEGSNAWALPAVLFGLLALSVVYIHFDHLRKYDAQDWPTVFSRIDEKVIGQKGRQMKAPGIDTPVCLIASDGFEAWVLERKGPADWTLFGTTPDAVKWEWRLVDPDPGLKLMRDSQVLFRVPLWAVKLQPTQPEAACDLY